MPPVQSYENHTRFDPVFHFFLAPLFLANFIYAVTHTIRHWPDHYQLSLWWVVMALAALVAVFKIRNYALANQDRLIRLEERLRLSLLLSPEQMARTEALTTRQFVALRFASDAELPALALRAVGENLAPKQIKQSIVQWRPDLNRI